MRGPNHTVKTQRGWSAVNTLLSAVRGVHMALTRFIKAGSDVLYAHIHTVNQLPRSMHDGHIALGAHRQTL